jgi:predicted  nucleic acid-binding Zn-ribbon protein
MAKKELTVEEKLKQLYELQLIDNELVELEILKGELPIEVGDLEDELAGLETRVKRLENNVKDIEDEIRQNEANIHEANNLIVKYNSQLDNIKNNREYESLLKEIELQGLDIKIFEKRIREGRIALEKKLETLKHNQERVAAKKKDLDLKKLELEKITVDTDKQVKKLNKEADKLRKNIEERLLKAYDRIRRNYRNGLAVVTVERNSCGGCFNNVPPQLKLEIGQRKKIIACEHCGRILVDPNIMVVPQEEEVK